MPPGASTSAADPKLPPESRKLAGFLPVPPVTKEPHFRPLQETIKSIRVYHLIFHARSSVAEET